jgi:hypothetical protein
VSDDESRLAGLPPTHELDEEDRPVEYKWRRGSSIGKVKPDEAARIFDEIRQEHGVLTPELVLEEAKDPKSPLHPHFEWDDTVAARKYRVSQAKRLITTLVVRTSVIERRAHVYVRHEEPAAQRKYPKRVDASYLPLDAALANPGSRKQIVMRALRELQAFRRKYRDLSELSALWDEFDRIQKGISA